MCEDNANLKVFPPIHRFGNSGRWIRAKLLAGILHGTPVLLHIQNLRTPRLNMIMKMVSFLGEEEFYTPLVAAIVWGHEEFSLPPKDLLRQSFRWNVAMTGRCQATTPVLSVNVPMVHLVLYVPTQQQYVVVCSSSFFSFSPVLWSFSVMFSRIVPGVHSPADIVVGGILGCLFASRLAPLGSLYRLVMFVSSAGSSLVILTVVMVLLYIHPDPNQPPYVMAAAFLCKESSVFYVSNWFGLEPVCEKRKSVVTSEKIHYSNLLCCVGSDVAGEDNTHDNKTVLNLDIPVKFLAYLSMGFAAVNLVPAIFHMLNI
eukprot:Em0674g3a